MTLRRECNFDWYGRCELQVRPNKDGDNGTAYFLMISRVEKAERYSRDDLWVVSNSPYFPPQTSVLLRAVYFGPVRKVLKGLVFHTISTIHPYYYFLDIKVQRLEQNRILPSWSHGYPLFHSCHFLLCLFFLNFAAFSQYRYIIVMII